MVSEGDDGYSQLSHPSLALWESAESKVITKSMTMKRLPTKTKDQKVCVNVCVVVQVICVLCTNTGAFIKYLKNQ